MQRLGIRLYPGMTVTEATLAPQERLRNTSQVEDTISPTPSQLFQITCKGGDKLSKLEADYVLLATGSSPQGHTMAERLGHTIIAPCPSLFTFVVDDVSLTAMAGVSVSKVSVRLELPESRSATGRQPGLQQEGPLLVTHWYVGLRDVCMHVCLHMFTCIH